MNIGFIHSESTRMLQYFLKDVLKLYYGPWRPKVQDWAGDLGFWAKGFRNFEVWGYCSVTKDLGSVGTPPQSIGAFSNTLENFYLLPNSPSSEAPQEKRDRAGEIRELGSYHRTPETQQQSTLIGSLAGSCPGSFNT